MSRYAKNLIGKTFGQWTVVSRQLNAKNASARWFCRCNCGTEKTHVAGTLFRGGTKSCGCDKFSLQSIVHTKDLIGHRFGRLIVMSRNGSTKNNKGSKWLCKCDCGSSKTVSAQSLKRKTTQSCGCLAKEYQKTVWQKENHPLWKGGISQDRWPRHSIEYTTWRLSVYRRDGFKCQCCNKVGGYLNAHHILSWAKYPKERFDIENGITLCIKCHKKLHRKNKKYA